MADRSDAIRRQGVEFSYETFQVEPVLAVCRESEIGALGLGKVLVRRRGYSAAVHRRTARLAACDLPRAYRPLEEAFFQVRLITFANISFNTP